MGSRYTWVWSATRLALGLAMLVGGLTAVGLANAQEPTTIIQLETPTSGTAASTRLMISGWAVDPAGEGTGVDVVQLYLGDPNAGGQLLGTATYGQPRPEAARIMDDPRFTNSGFELAVELPAGNYTLYVYAHLNALGLDQGWAASAVRFQASANVRPDPRAAALLGGDQPQVRAAAPPSTGAASNAAPRPTGQQGIFTSGVDATSGALRTSVSRNDPMPLDPLGVPGVGYFTSPGREGPDLVDSMGAPVSQSAATNSQGVRQSVVSETNPTSNYRTGQVSLVGGSGTQCPGPNCPATQANLANNLNNLPPDLVRQVTGYNLPGVGTSQPCTPSSGVGGCNPSTGTANDANAPTSADQMRQRLQQQLNNVGQNAVQSPVNTGPNCTQYNASGQCAQVTGQTGFNGSVCLRWAGSQCTYYGQPNQQAGGAPLPGVAQPASSGSQSTAQQAAAAGLTPAQLAALQSGSTGSQPATQPAISGYLNQSGYLPAGSATASSSTAAQTAAAQASLYQPTLASAPGPVTSTATAGYTTAPTAATGGVCVQFGPSGQCIASR